MMKSKKVILKFKQSTQRWNDLCVQIGSHWRSAKFHAKDWSHVAITQKRIHQWCLTLTPNNTKTIERMTYHCFLRPIRRGPYEQLLHNRKHSPKTQWRNALHMSKKYNNNNKEKTTGLFSFLFPDPFGLRCQSDSGIAFRRNHNKWKSIFNSQHKDT